MMRNRRVWLLVFFAMASLWSCRGAIPMNSDSAWQWVAPMPEQRTRLEAFLTSNGYIQVVGGILPLSVNRTSLSPNNPDYNNKTPDSERWFLTYDITHDRWKSTSINLNPASDLSRLHRGMAVTRNAQGDFYWIGGTGKDHENVVLLLKTGQNANPEQDLQGDSETLVKLTPLREEREQHRAVQTLDGKILVMGGMKRAYKGRVYSPSDVIEILNAVECFDPKTNSWQNRAAMIHPRMAFTAVVLGDGKVMVCGGVNGKLDSYEGKFRALTMAELYDPVLNRWQELAPMPQPRLSHAAVLAPDGRIWVIGGADVVHERTNFSNSSYTVHRTVFIYDPKANRWIVGPEMHIARRNCAVVCTSSGRIYAIGDSNFGLYKTRSILGHEIPLRNMAGEALASMEMLDTTKWSARK
jgi:N-acetylneuraminic acid mutarotase